MTNEHRNWYDGSTCQLLFAYTKRNFACINTETRKSSKTTRKTVYIVPRLNEISHNKMSKLNHHKLSKNHAGLRKKKTSHQLIILHFLTKKYFSSRIIAKIDRKHGNNK